MIERLSPRRSGVFWWLSGIAHQFGLHAAPDPLYGGHMRCLDCGRTPRR